MCLAACLCPGEQVRRVALRLKEVEEQSSGSSTSKSLETWMCLYLPMDVVRLAPWKAHQLSMMVSMLALTLALTDYLGGAIGFGHLVDRCFHRRGLAHRRLVLGHLDLLVWPSLSTQSRTAVNTAIKTAIESDIKTSARGAYALAIETAIKATGLRMYVVPSQDAISNGQTFTCQTLDAITHQSQANCSPWVELAISLCLDVSRYCWLPTTKTSSLRAHALATENAFTDGKTSACQTLDAIA
ncbi:hypothetical protein B0A55_10190, partial [Friedmanniomyces simplex]